MLVPPLSGALSEWMRNGPPLMRDVRRRPPRQVVEHGFTVGRHRIGLGVYAFNPRAQRVYEKCGFVVEGRLRDTLWWGGEWHDELRMAVLSP